MQAKFGLVETGNRSRASGGGAKRHAAMRDLMVSVRDRPTGAKRPSRGCGRARISSAGPASVARSERERAKAPGIVTPKGEDRVSGLRGAGRGEAAPGGIEPGARSLDRAGAPIIPVGQRAISGSSSTTIANRPRRKTKLAILKCRWGRMGIAGRRTSERPATARKRRDGREAARAARCRRAASGARAAAARSAAAAMRDTGHGAKKGPVPRRSEGPALMGCGSASVRRRR